ncbi:MAG: transposase [Methylocella sp.]
MLRTTGKAHNGRTILYRASKCACDPCPLKSRCCANAAWRKVPRDVNEEARDHARALMGTPGFDKSRDERKQVEMQFAHLKTHHRLEHMRLRGLDLRARRVPSRGHRAKPRVTRKLPLVSAAKRAHCVHGVRLG